MRTIYIKMSYLKLILIIIIIFLIDYVFVIIQSKDIEYNEYELKMIELYNDKKLLVLTFDDGPSKYTDSLLEILENYNVRATFFVLGEKIDKYPNTIIKASEDKNLICVHSYNHVFFTEIPKEEILKQINTTYSLIKNLTGIEPSYIRVPYGRVNSNVTSILKDLHIQNVLWNVDSLDWSYKNKYKTVKHIKSTTTGNDVILMHDIYQSSIDAVNEIIPYYQDKGYVFVTISEFYRIKKLAQNFN